MDRIFRFGAVAGLAPGIAEWTGLARRAEELGYATLLVPDTTRTLSPFAAIAAAAQVTSSLRFGTFVLSVSNREPGVVAWETRTLDLLTGGRLELGLGRSFGTPGERYQLLVDTIAAVKQSVQPRILIAAGGPRMTRLAVDEADIITISAPPQAGEDELKTRIDRIREYAGDRVDQLELSANLIALGDEPPRGMPLQVDLSGSAAVLRGSVDDMVDTLLRRRESLGISYVSVNAAYLDQLAPVVERLAGT